MAGAGGGVGENPGRRLNPTFKLSHPLLHKRVQYRGKCVMGGGAEKRSILTCLGPECLGGLAWVFGGRRIGRWLPAGADDAQKFTLPNLQSLPLLQVVAVPIVDSGAARLHVVQISLYDVSTDPCAHHVACRSSSQVVQNKIPSPRNLLHANCRLLHVGNVMALYRRARKNPMEADSRSFVPCCI